MNGLMRKLGLRKEKSVHSVQELKKILGVLGLEDSLDSILPSSFKYANGSTVLPGLGTAVTGETVTQWITGLNIGFPVNESDGKRNLDITISGTYGYRINAGNRVRVDDTYKPTPDRNEPFNYRTPLPVLERVAQVSLD